MNKQTQSLVLLPTYCEAGTIGRVLEGLLCLPRDIEVLVIDDNSPDGTADEVRTFQARFEGRVHLLQRAGKLGLGTAYVEGFEWALQRGYAVVVQMDSDLSHDPADVLRLLYTVRSGADAAFGSRYISGGRTENWGRVRRFLSRNANRYARFCLGVPIRDLTGGFNAWKTEVIRAIQPRTLTLKGYGFLVGLKYRAFQKNFTLREIPICFRERRNGSSKMSMAIILEAAIKVPQIPRGV